MHAYTHHRIPPSLFATAALIAGIVWQAQGLSTTLGTGLLAIALFLSYISRRSPYVTRVLFLIIAFCFGSLRYTYQEYEVLRAKQQLCNKKVSISGTIIKIIPLSESHATVYVALEKPCNATVSLAMPCGSYETGDYVQAHGVRFAPTDKNRRACAYGYLRTYTSLGAAQQTRTFLMQKIDATCSAANAALIRSIFFGYPLSSVSQEMALRTSFSWWGISHYLARSGLHLVIFVSIMHLFMMLIPVPLVAKRLLTALVLFIYTLFSYPTLSFVRALLMAALALICALLSLRQQPLHTISIVCCLLLLYQPLYLFSLDFQLTFALTFALIVAYQRRTLERISRNTL